MTDIYFIKEALKEARKSFDENEVPVGAVISYNNKIIARAGNQVELLNDSTAHAEILAITAAEASINSRFLNDCTIYISLEPCLMCLGAIYLANIKKIVYAAEDNKKGFSNYLKNNDITKKIEVKKGIMASESKQLLKQFFDKLRK